MSTDQHLGRRLRSHNLSRQHKLRGRQLKDHLPDLMLGQRFHSSGSSRQPGNGKREREEEEDEEEEEEGGGGRREEGGGRRREGGGGRGDTCWVSDATAPALLRSRAAGRERGREAEERRLALRHVCASVGA
ncbi:unnamed protein product [Prorocentrum cordatum]|uniref:Uncharacterized protein n=1 Tax=Prorocentrum cordatum TaxID=2364126 RepID=A0ABN9VTP4_9DINO|nr:unnamed protein product [Polarella glacialis]